MRPSLRNLPVWAQDVERFLETIDEFAETWALLRGGPGSATETMLLYLYLT